MNSESDKEKNDTESEFVEEQTYHIWVFVVILVGVALLGFVILYWAQNKFLSITPLPQVKTDPSERNDNDVDIDLKPL